MLGKIIDSGTMPDGKQYVSLKLVGNVDLDQLQGLELDIEMKKHRPKRSRNANSYLWELVTKIADAMPTAVTKEEIYLEMLKRYGQCGMVSILDTHLEAFKRTYKYTEEIGHAELNGKSFTHVRFWIGSSEYNSKEMSVLVDGVVQEAQSMGIDTDTPERVLRLKEEWGA